MTLPTKEPFKWCKTHNQQFIWAGRETCLGFDAWALMSGNGCNVVELMTRAEWEATMTEATDEVWISETFGAYRVIDEHGTIKDTVTDMPGRKVYVDAAIGETDDD